MKKYIHDFKEFPPLFEKLAFETAKFGASYTAMMFEIDKNDDLEAFWKFLLKNLRISDTLFYFSENRLLLVLEETTLRWWLVLNQKIREKLSLKWLNFHFYCSAIQWNFIDEKESLFKALKKRLKVAKECATTNCAHSLSCIDNS